MDPLVLAATIAAVSSVLTAIIGLANRRNLSGKDGLVSQVKENTDRLMEVAKWQDGHALDHKITDRDLLGRMQKEIERLGGNL